ncbi:MAG: recombination-associated protein RdgC [Deltaproteobacteria bacterium]|nr:recombination-associated protein RdgC [Deltaproteobacteria bacterium]MBW2049944.1 recombination-associated protein RdgC [Deltaproteobacteria bacterium]MBW2113186.1 recombination-associated protein RdgC [Deltaproteobacteria bacterium]MBW2354545.1 recombination-associated protein RdgC [Deltaproteobacteria bacterium]HDZ89609.1 hypothetical protein [Deltaproteobacteria bacterium]
MGLISGSTSFTRYLAKDSLPEDFMKDLSEKITRHSFQGLDEQSVDERSFGWVNIMNMFDSRFAGLEFLKEPYITMSLRVDERKVPATALKQHCLEAEERIKRDENLEYLPKNRRLDIKEGVRMRLLRRAIPASRCYDMVWNYSTGLVIFGSTSNRICDEFVELFLKTFGIELLAICPYILAGRALEKQGTSLDLLDGLVPWDFEQER